MRPNKIDILTLNAGMAILQAAHVEPLGLDIRPGGEWSFYQFVALPGHPNPGNAGRGFTHPTTIDAFRLSSGRIGRGDLLVSFDGKSDAQIHAWCAGIARAIWPGCPHESTVERTSDKSLFFGAAITRRITDEVRLVAATLFAGVQQQKIMLRGGQS